MMSEALDATCGSRFAGMESTNQVKLLEPEPQAVRPAAITAARLRASVFLSFMVCVLLYKFPSYSCKKPRCSTVRSTGAKCLMTAEWCSVMPRHCG